MSLSRRSRWLLLLVLSIAACATGTHLDESAGAGGEGGSSANGSAASGVTSSSAAASTQASTSAGSTGSGQGGAATTAAGTGAAGTGGTGASMSTTTNASSTGSGGAASSSSTGAGAAGGGGTCGDGTVGASEQCDDGDTMSGDGCSASCTWETNCQNDNPHPAITCGQTLNGTFFGVYGDVENLCGKPFLYQDQIFVFTAATDATVTAVFTASPDLADMAMFVMEGSCHSGLCFADSTSDANRHDVTFQAKAGWTYYIDLEAPSNQPNYSITLQCN